MIDAVLYRPAGDSSPLIIVPHHLPRYEVKEPTAPLYYNNTNTSHNDNHALRTPRKPESAMRGGGRRGWRLGKRGHPPSSSDEPSPHLGLFPPHWVAWRLSQQFCRACASPHPPHPTFMHTTGSPRHAQGTLVRHVGRRHRCRPPEEEEQCSATPHRGRGRRPHVGKQDPPHAFQLLLVHGLFLGVVSTSAHHHAQALLLALPDRQARLPGPPGALRGPLHGTYGKINRLDLF